MLQKHYQTWFLLSNQLNQSGKAICSAIAKSSIGTSGKASSCNSVLIFWSNLDWDAHVPWKFFKGREWSNLLLCCSRPMKAAVAAVAEHLAGLVPTEVTYSHAHQNTAQVWNFFSNFYHFEETLSRPITNLIRKHSKDIFVLDNTLCLRMKGKDMLELTTRELFLLRPCCCPWTCVIEMRGGGVLRWTFLIDISRWNEWKSIWICKACGRDKDQYHFLYISFSCYKVEGSTTFNI